MTRCLPTQLNMRRLSLADRSEPLAAIIQNKGVNCICALNQRKAATRMAENDCSRCIKHSQPRARSNVSLTRLCSFPIARS